MRIPGVYAIVNRRNGKIYIGSSGNCLVLRLRDHRRLLKQGKHYNCYLQSAWTKWGCLAFSFRILERCESNQCLTREQYWIDRFESSDRRKGYNLCPLAASPLGVKHGPRSEETKKLMSKVKLGNKYALGVIKDEATRARMSEAARERCKLIKPPNNEGSLNGMVKLSVEDVLEIRRLYRRGSSFGEGSSKELAKRFNVCRVHISDIASGRAWKSVS